MQPECLITSDWTPTVFHEQTDIPNLRIPLGQMSLLVAHDVMLPLQAVPQIPRQFLSVIHRTQLPSCSGEWGGGGGVLTTMYM